MKKLVFVLCSSNLLSPSCFANDDVLPPLEVIAKTVITSAFERSAVIDRNEIEASSGIDINTVLSGQPGLQINQSKAGAGSGLSLKGASGGLGLATFDGIPLFANFAGLYALRNYPLDAIENISVSHFNGLAMENSRTLGGVIQLNSRQLSPGTGHVQLEAGSRQRYATSASAGVESPLGDISMAAGWDAIKHGDSQAGPQNGGYEHDDQSLGHALVNVNKTFTNGNLFASFYYVHGNDDIDGPAIITNPAFKVIWADDPNGWFSDETLVAQATTDLAITDNWHSTLQIGGTQYNQDGIAGAQLRRSLQLDSSLWLAKWQNTHSLALNNTLPGDISMMWGMEYQDQHAETNATQRSLNKQLFSPNLGLAWDIGQWNLYAKTRRDITDDGAHNLWSLGTAYHITADARVWANAGTSFRMASVNEILHPLYGNLTLKPSSGRGWDMGWADQLTDSTELQLSYYHQHYRQMIIFQQDLTTGLASAANQPDVVVQGVDAELRQTWTNSWNTTLRYGYMDADNRLLHKSVPVRPRNKLSLINNLQLNPKLDLNVQLNFHDGYWFDNQHTTRASSATRLNLALHYAMTPAVMTYVRVDNLTDNDTIEVNGFGYQRRAVYAGVRGSW